MPNSAFKAPELPFLNTHTETKPKTSFGTTIFVFLFPDLFFWASFVHGIQMPQLFLSKFERCASQLFSLWQNTLENQLKGGKVYLLSDVSDYGWLCVEL
jgi:hypothetical protein